MNSVHSLNSIDELLGYYKSKVKGDPKRFTMIRNGDESGVSGTGRVADGCVWPSGKVTLTWRTDTPSTANFDSYDDFYNIHIKPHPANKTEIKWLDKR
jgi:hypothetical protein